MTPTIVSGAISTLTDLERDESWLQGWLKEEPSRLGLGQLSTDTPSDEQAAQDGGFTASLDGRCFSVDVQLGELDASHGFGVLDAWARNKVRLPDKEHVAVLVTESCGERYRATLQTLSGHLPLVVIELAVWRGQDEAIVVPHVALASEGVDLGSAPASAAAKAMDGLRASANVSAKKSGAAKSASADGAKGPEATPVATAEEGEEPAGDKDDTGVADPWGLPRKEPEAAAASTTSNGGSRLLTRFNT
jgi:hypothetical protein